MKSRLRAVFHVAVAAVGVPLASASAASYPATAHPVLAFPSCEAFGAYVMGGGEVGLATPHIVSVLGRPEVARLRDGTWRASLSVAWKFDDASTLAVDHVSWPQMTKAQRAGLQRLYAAVENHERGHFDASWKAVDASPSVLEATGASAREATANLQDELSRSAADVQAKLARANEAYDAATEHGVRQSLGPSQGFRGGSDAISSC